MSVRIGVDVGGTFTDIVCFDEHGEDFRLLKVPSTPDHPSAAVIEGTRRVLSQFGVPAESVRFFIHGTTVATNTILERKGAEVALLVTAGFRDVPYIMRQDRPRLYDYFQQRPQPLIPRERCRRRGRRSAGGGAAEEPDPTNAARRRSRSRRQGVWGLRRGCARCGRRRGIADLRGPAGSAGRGRRWAGGG